MKNFIIDFIMIVIFTIIVFFFLYGIGGIIGMKVLCLVSLIIGITWWVICEKHQELIDEIKDLKKEIKQLEEKK